MSKKKPKMDPLAALLVAGGVFTGIAALSHSGSGSAARLKTSSAREAWSKESQTYLQKNLLLLAVREAVQNSLDAVRAAIATNVVSANEAFIGVWIDEVNRRIIFEDTGIGMDESRLDKFLTLLGTEKAEGASGGWGVAKAVIFKISNSYKLKVRTQDMFVPVQGFQDEGGVDEPSIKDLPYYQGTTIIIEDVNPDYLPYHPRSVKGRALSNNSSNTFGGNWVDSKFGVYDLVEALLSFVGTDIPIYFGYTRDAKCRFIMKKADPFWLKRKSGVSQNPSDYGFEPVQRSLNIGDGGNYSGKELIKIDPASGRKTRKSSPFSLLNKGGKFLKGDFFLGSKKDVGLEGIGRSLLMCVRLNDMFMFWTTEYVTAKNLKDKIILMDLFTNIRPYEEEQYPVTKTREGLNNLIEDVKKEMIGVMDRESLSAGSNYAGRIMLPSRMSGLKHIQKSILKSFFQDMKASGIPLGYKTAFKDVLLDDSGQNAISTLIKGGDGTEKVRTENEIVYPNETLAGNEDFLCFFAPCGEGEIPESGTDFKTYMKKGKHVLVRLMDYLSYDDTMTQYLYAVIDGLDQYLNKIGGTAWEGFLRRPKPEYYRLNKYTLLPPVHLIFMDVRDVLYVFYRKDRKDETWQILMAKLNILIAIFSGAFDQFGSRHGYLWRESEESESVICYNAQAFVWFFSPTDQNIVDKVDRFLEDAIADVDFGVSNRDLYAGWCYGTSEPSIYVPKLAVTRKYFPDSSTPRFWKNYSKQMELIKILGNYLDGPGDSSDIMDFPRRIAGNLDKYEDQKAETPFMLNETYAKTQAICIIQSLYKDLTHEDANPHLLWGSKENMFGVEFIFHFLEEKKIDLVSTLSYALQEGHTKGANTVGTKLKNLYSAIKNFHKALPARIINNSLLPKELKINPFDGFCPVRYSMDFSARNIYNIERKFLSYLPILICWSTITELVEVLCPNVWALKEAEDERNIATGLAFGGDFVAMMQVFGRDGAFLWLNAETGMVQSIGKVPVEVWGSQLYSTIVHEFAHVVASSDGHGQGYAQIRDYVLDITLPYLGLMLNLMAKIMSEPQPKVTVRTMELEARLALRQTELKTKEQEIKKLKKQAKKRRK